MYPIDYFLDEVTISLYYKLGFLNRDDISLKNRYLSLERLKHQMRFNYAYMRCEVYMNELYKRRRYNDCLADTLFHKIINMPFKEAVNDALEYYLKGGEIIVY